MCGQIVFYALNLCGWSYRLCTRAATIVIIVVLVGKGETIVKSQYISSMQYFGALTNNGTSSFVFE